MRPLILLLLASLIALAPTSACDSSVQGPDDGDGEEYSHLRGTGASARDFLSADTYTSLVIEVDYMPGHAPDADAVEDLRSFLAARLHKSAITIRTTEIPTGGQSSYSLEDVRALEEEHRDDFTDGTTLAAYMLIVDGEYQQPNVLGIAHLNTSTAYFGATIDQISGGLTQPSRRLVEATVFRHEFGHLFGLVAIPGSGTDMQTEHRDEAHGHHCDDDRCLMYYGVETTDLLGLIIEGQVPELDANCLADLAANGGK